MSANVKSQALRSSNGPRLGGYALVAASCVLAFAGCGSSKSASTPSTESTPAAPATATSPASGATSLSLAANPEGQFSFDKKALSAKAGAVSIAFTNQSSVEHNVTIESSSGEKVGETATFTGGSKTLSVILKAGTYKFYCSVPGHRQSGMEGTLTIQ